MTQIWKRPNLENPTNHSADYAKQASDAARVSAKRMIQWREIYEDMIECGEQEPTTDPIVVSYRCASYGVWYQSMISRMVRGITEADYNFA